MKLKGLITDINNNSPGFLIFTIDDKIRIKFTKKLNFEIEIGKYIATEGNFIVNKYGRTFVAENVYETDKPKNLFNILPIFISGLGPKKAQEIAATLGDDYIDILKEHPINIYTFYLTDKSKSIIKQIKKEYKQLFKLPENEIAKYISKNVKGIGIKKANELIQEFKPDVKNKLNDNIALCSYFSSNQGNEIYNQIKNLQKYFDILKDLKKIGYSNKLSLVLIENYKLETLNKLLDNPYIPISYGMDFEDADEIAINHFNFDKLSIHRIVNASVSVLKNYESEGNTFAKLENVINEVSEITNINDFKYIDDIIKMASEFEEPEFIIKDDKIYRRVIFFTERKISLMLKNKINASKNYINQNVKTFIDNSSLSETQKKSVKELIQNKISILTGGPGTGKTRTIEILCKSLDLMNKSYLLAAPTGRASKRMNESTGKEATTIHRLLQYKSMGIMGKFLKNEYNQIKEDYVIIDETSMLDVYLMNSLLKSLSSNTSLIMVGDINQLPSVSMGSILRDIKDSGKVKVCELTEIFRQSENSLISINADNIMKDKIITNKKGSDCSFIKIKNKKQFDEIIDKIISKGKEFQMLCPMKNGIYGNENINHIIQDKLNKSKESIFIANKLFKLNDKVIQLSNDYNKEVFNGEVGTIKEINEKEVTVYFPDNIPQLVKYKHKEMRKLDLAYSITIHKSQGSEFKNVILVIDGNKDFLSKELIYTGMTRAKETLTILSVYDLEFYKSLKTSNNRSTNLTNLLKY